MPSVQMFKPQVILHQVAAGMFPKYFMSEQDIEQKEKDMTIGQRFIFLLRETGYFHIQATKPDTAGM